MRKTTTAVAVGAAALALPATAAADEPPTGTVLTSWAQMHAARERQVVRVRTRRVVHRAHRLARLRHRRFSARTYRRRLRGELPAHLHHRLRALRQRIEHARRPAPAAAASPTLQAIAACESGGNPAADTGNGFYGKYQFTVSTWQSIGGTGNPAAASEAEQDRRAAMLYARDGAAPWPVCGR
jgi:Transglycosylase-like domain